MLKKPLRLTTDFHFKVTRKYGNKYNFPLFSIYICSPLNYRGSAKFGVVTTTSFHKDAVKRNKAKRVLTELIRKNVTMFPKDTWVIIYPKPAILLTNYENISSDFNKALQEIFFTR